MFTNKDLEKYQKAAERILGALDKSSVSVQWNKAEEHALQSIIVKELMLIDREAKR